MVILNFMKTAVSLQDDLFRRAEALAKRLGVARSRLYAMALTEFLDAHECDVVTEALDAVYADLPSHLDRHLAAAQTAAIPDEDW
ncbi:hypothetical protein BMS3Bbin01_02757 [bacterium BMS3Bbin01]|nr:hypothetical protein BMS3Bbin01_02757 [bacterium BMS3Bbin01]